MCRKFSKLLWETCQKRNLWNLNLRREVLEQAGPLGSLMRHTTSVADPNIPRYARTGQWPVCHLRDLNAFPNIDAMAHQHYLEQLSFQTQILNQWTRMTADQIDDERERGQHPGQHGARPAGQRLDKASSKTSAGIKTDGTTSAADATGPNADAAAKPDFAAQASTGAEDKWSTSQFISKLTSSQSDRSRVPILGSKDGMSAQVEAASSTTVKHICATAGLGPKKSVACVCYNGSPGPKIHCRHMVHYF